MPVEILGLHHYTLRTSDLKRATAFYEGVFGLKRKPQPGMVTRTVRYELDEAEIHLLEVDDLPLIHETPDPRESHLALEVDNIHNAVAACLSGGAEMQQVTFVRDEDGSQSAYLRDPDGNLIELCSHPTWRSRRSPGLGAVGSTLPASIPLAVPVSGAMMASAPELPSEMATTFNAEEYFSNRNQKRENWRLLLTTLIAFLLLGIGAALRYTIFKPKYGTGSSWKTGKDRATAGGSLQAGNGTSPDTTATATPIPTPTPATEQVSPSLSESNGLPAPAAPVKP